MADTSIDRDALVSQFCELTGASPDEAEPYLASNNWDLSAAATEYYTSQEEAEAVPEDNMDTEEEQLGDEEAEEDDDEEEEEIDYRGSTQVGRVLGDGSAAPASASKSKASSAKSKKAATQAPRRGGIATLRDLNQGRSHNHDDEDDDEDDENEEHEKDKGRDLYAGGGKSGLAVKDPADPRKTVKGIIDRARKNMGAPEEDSPGPRSSRFSGAGQTLGGDDAPSRTISDPNAEAPKPRTRVARTLHFWQNGFSVEDGPLYRFDDPQSAPILALIKSGRAPLHIMGVQADQPVDVTVAQHEEDYVQPKKKYKPFSGGGQRLGSPTPAATGASGGGGSSSSTSGTRAAAAVQSSSNIPSSSSTEPARPAIVDVNESEPTISLQIRLGDGTRLSSRFNTTHTIGDIYDFVRASSPASAHRSWVLMTTFPSTELSDKGAKLGDLAEFRRGGVMVQKWV